MKDKELKLKVEHFAENSKKDLKKKSTFLNFFICRKRPFLHHRKVIPQKYLYRVGKLGW
jgi:hypothetical protein